MKYLNIKNVLSGLLLFGIVISPPTILFSQGNNNTLSFANQYFDQDIGTVFNLPSFPNNINDVYHGQVSEFTHTAIQDENGDLLFFIVDGNIYDSEGYLIEMLFGDGGFGFGIAQVTGTSETLVVPDPFNCKKYYIFACGINNDANEGFPFFTILDLDQTNVYHSTRKGAINPLDLDNYIHTGTAISIPRNTDNFLTLAGASTPKTLINTYFSAPKIQDCNTDQFVYLSSGKGIFQYKITENNFAFTGQFIEYPYFPNTITEGQRGEMEIIELGNGNYRIAAPYNFRDDPNATSGIAIFHAELDSDGILISGTENTTIIASPINEERAYINGMEFSQSGRYLYVTHNVTLTYENPIEYIDYNSGVYDLIPLNVSNATDFEHSQIETNKDGFLIFATNNRIAALSGTDGPDIGNWIDNFVFPLSYSLNTLNVNPLELRGKRSYIIPKQIKQRSYSDYIFEGGCADPFEGQPFTGTWSPGAGNNPFNSQNGEVYVDFTITIPAGSNLTIEDMIFYFTPGNKFIVERGNGSSAGANVNILRTKLTVDDRCDQEAMWGGVEVHGYQNENQFPMTNSKQGKFFMRDNSTIEHAYRGIAATRIINSTIYPFRPVSVDNNYVGGLVRATDSDFLNNQRDVEIQTYIPPNNVNNGAIFRRSNFITDGLLKDTGVLPDVHILLNGVEGVRFRGINVHNITPEDYQFDQRGRGVIALTSRFSIEPDCLGFAACNETNPSFVPSTFSNLTFGVGAASFNSARTFVINRARFINNYYGITAYNIDNERITRNHFEVLPTATPNANVDSYGVYLGGCDGYIVEENFLTKYNDPAVSAIGNTYGIVVDNSGEEPNEIYNNDFTELLVGLQGQRINGFETATSPDGVEIIKGLEFKCNNFFGNIYEADMNVTSGRIRRQQGQCFSSTVDADRAPAGNKLSSSEFTLYNDFGVSVNPIVDQEIAYAHHFNSAPYITELVRFSTDQINVNPCFNNDGTPRLYDPIKSCPSQLAPEGGIIGVPIDNFVTIRGKLDSMQMVINDLINNIDGGNKQELLDVILTGSNEDVLTALLSASPYLSDEVLLAYIASNPPSGHLAQVISANSPLSDQVMSVLEEIKIPKGIQNQIDAEQFGTSERTILNEIINFESDKRHKYLNRSISLILADSTLINPADTVAKILKFEEGRTRKVQRCDALICAGQEAEFMQEANDFDNLYSNNITQVALRDNDVRHYELDLTDTTNTDLIAFLEATESDLSDQRAAARARTMLDIIFRQFQPGIVEKLVLGVGGKSVLTNNDEASVMETTKVNLYPNPTNGEYVTLLFIEQLPVNPTVTVYSLTGVEMSRTTFKTNEQLSLGVKGLNTGLYIISIESNGELVDNLKLIIK